MAWPFGPGLPNAHSARQDARWLSASPADLRPGDILVPDGTKRNFRFSTSCNDVAQRRFDCAMRYQHSFWYRESKGLFEAALAADPGCAIA
jgi:hypothetical protein